MEGKWSNAYLVLLTQFFCINLKGEEITRETKRARKSGGLAGSSSDESYSESDASDNEESDNESSRFLSSGDDDDFNPFRDESSEDDEDGEQWEQLLIN